MNIQEIPEGALAKTTKEFRKDGFSYGEGTEFEVEEYVSADDAEDGIPFYWGSNNGGMNNITVRAAHAEMVRSAEDMRNRKPPTPQEIANAIASQILGTHGAFTLDQSDTGGFSTGGAEIYGVTNEGLHFGFTLRVGGVQETDF